MRRDPPVPAGTTYGGPEKTRMETWEVKDLFGTAMHRGAEAEGPVEARLRAFLPGHAGKNEHGMFRHCGTADVSSLGQVQPQMTGPAHSSGCEPRANPSGAAPQERRTQLSFQLNVDHPKKRAILHRSDSQDPRCQPGEKKRRIGYWQGFDDPSSVLAFVDGIGERLHLCSKCRPMVTGIG